MAVPFEAIAAVSVEREWGMGDPDRFPVVVQLDPAEATRRRVDPRQPIQVFGLEPTDTAASDRLAAWVRAELNRDDPGKR